MPNLLDPLVTYITPYRKDAMNCVSTQDYANRGILVCVHVETQFIASYHLRLICYALSIAYDPLANYII